MSINWYPGHMYKTKGELIENVKNVDIVVEMLDARIPLSSSNPDIDEIIKNNARLIILNKADLADNKENERWQKYFKESEKRPSMLLNSESEDDIEKVVEKIQELCIEKTDALKQKGIKNPNIKVMVLGIPNVGKSTLINKLVGKKSAEVGNKPGVTRKINWLKTKYNIQILDTPGILWPKINDEEVGLNLAVVGSIKDDILELSEVVYHLINKIYEAGKLDGILNRYNITNNEMKEYVQISLGQEKLEPMQIYNLLELIGKKRGHLIKGGQIDEEKVYNNVLLEFRKGNFGKITLERI